MTKPRRFLIVDACVLIDFVNTDRTVIRLASQEIGPLHVASPTFEEVEGLDMEEARALDLRVVEPAIELALEAASRKGTLSFQDWLCLLMAKENGWTCITNDGHMRRECEAVGVEVLWGLEVVAMLVEAGAMKSATALEIGEAIQAANRFITPAVLARFAKRVGGRR